MNNTGLNLEQKTISSRYALCQTVVLGEFATKRSGIHYYLFDNIVQLP